MKFESRHIKGKGRGKKMGFPTINLKIPSNFELEDGVYASKVTIDGKTYSGALHYGPVATFNEWDKTLEVYLIDLGEKKLDNLDEKIVVVEIVKYIRAVMKFDSKEALIKQIEKDVSLIKKALHFPDSNSLMR